MGWASASEIFDPVAHALIELGANADTMRRVLGTLIGQLQDMDWDTEDESLEEFRDSPVIVQLFYEHEVGNRAGEWPEGAIGYDPSANEWTLTCQGGPDACGEIGRGAGDSRMEHDRLVRLWASHEADEHGGDGQVAERMLLDRVSQESGVVKPEVHGI